MMPHKLTSRLRVASSYLSLLLVLAMAVFHSLAFAVNEEDLLQPDVAFQYSLQMEGDSTLLAQWSVAPGYYMYKDKIKLSLSKDAVLTLGEPQFPVSTRLGDPAFGDVDVFRGDFTVRYPMGAYSQADGEDYIKAKYQGCADVGVCYPPIRKKILVSSFGAITPDAGLASLSASTPPTGAAVEAPQLSEQDGIAASLSSDNLLLTLATFFGFGLLLAFTPCVFPMIPILSGIIIGQGEKISTRRAFSLSLAYVLAMASAYTMVGVLAALFGTNLQIWFQNPWILSSFALLFVILSLSMFGFYELQMPSAIQSKINKISNRQEGGKLISAAVMGLLSALIVGPCVTAPLVGALIYIGQTGDALLGGSALFALGLGMGAPLLVIGSSAAHLLPRAGAWMDAVKAVFGVLLLGVAIWLLDRVLAPFITQMLWAMLLIFSGIYLGALRQHSSETQQWQLFWKSLGFTFLLYGSIMMIGASTGRANLLHPLKSFTLGSSQAGSAAEHEGIVFIQIKGTDGLDKALESAKLAGKTVMLDFYADWCISCKEMEALTFTDPSVQSALSETINLQADVTLNDEEDQALLKRFGIIGPPAILFFNTQSEELKPYRTVGFMGADKFASHVGNALQ